jgi:ATP synthase protein I
LAARRPGGGEPPRSPYQYIGLGFEIIVPVVLFMFAGYVLDGWLGSGPWFFLVGALAGIAAGFYNLFRRILPPGGGGATS